MELYREDAEAEWAANTHIVEGDPTNAERQKAASEALARFTGGVARIEAARALLAGEGELTDLERRQLERSSTARPRTPRRCPRRCAR